MQAIVLCGIQGSGKSTFYKTMWADSHIRINLDMLNGNRNRETMLLFACLSMRQRFVVDNTNVSILERSRYLTVAKANGFETLCYYLDEELGTCIKRNDHREDKARVPGVGILATSRRLEVPTPAEGWDQLFYYRAGRLDRLHPSP